MGAEALCGRALELAWRTGRQRAPRAPAGAADGVDHAGPRAADGSVGAGPTGRQPSPAATSTAEGCVHPDLTGAPRPPLAADDGRAQRRRLWPFPAGHAGPAFPDTIGAGAQRTEVTQRPPQAATASCRRPACRSIKNSTTDRLTRFQAMPLPKAWA